MPGKNTSTSSSDRGTVLVKRFDNGEFDYMYRTDEGFLKGMAKVTRTGIFNYRNADGSTRRELRHPDDVFNLDSLNSLRMIPITNGHPEDRLVTADTAKSLSIGYTGESFMPDGQFVMLPVVVTDKLSIEQIESGKNELSLGYEVELDEIAGTYDGQNYDCRQKKIKYNHLAVVDRGRAGPDVRLNTDEAEQIIDSKDNVPHQQEGNTMPKLRLDNGCEYEAPQEVIAEVEKLRNDNQSLKTTLEETKTEFEKIRADADTAKETAVKLQERVDNIGQEITVGVTKRLELERIASQILGTEVKLDGLDENDIKSQVILKYFPNATLENQSSAYLDARYDAAVELSKNDDSHDDRSAAEQRKQVHGDSGNNVQTSSSTVRTSNQARNDMIERMKNMHLEPNANVKK